MASKTFGQGKKSFLSASGMRGIWGQDFKNEVCAGTHALFSPSLAWSRVWSLSIPEWWALETAWLGDKPHTPPCARGGGSMAMPGQAHADLRKMPEAGL